METMSISRALKELKLIDKRICDGIKRLQPCAYLGAAVTAEAADKFTKDADASITSLSALIRNAIAIKQKILASNSSTIVKIGNVEMTVTDAIARKALQPYVHQFLIRLQTERAQAKQAADQNMAHIADQANRMAAEVSKDKEAKSESYAMLRKAYLDANAGRYVAPDNLDSVIEALVKETEEFEKDVDWVLSDSNTRTMIDVTL